MNVGIIGATGYVGGRVAPALLAAGHRVRCLARTPSRLDGVPWRASVEVVKADVLDGASLSPAFEGLDAVYYLVHAMGHTQDFERVDRTGAQNTRVAAEEARSGSSRVPGRPRRRRPAGPVASPGQPARSGPDPRLGDGAADRAAGRGDHRLGERLLRDAAAPGGGAAGDGLPPVGDPHPLPAHRHRRRAALPSGRARLAGRGQPAHRDRRTRHPHLRRDDAALRGRGRAPKPPDRGSARAHPAPVVALAEPGHTPSHRDWPGPSSTAFATMSWSRSPHRWPPCWAPIDRLPSTNRCVVPCRTSKTSTSRPAGSTAPLPERPPRPCPRTPTGPEAPSSPTSEPCAPPLHRRRCSQRCPASAAPAAGTSPTGCGRPEGGSTSSSAGSGCGAAGAIPTSCGSATPSTSSGWRCAIRRGCCACGPR